MVELARNLNDTTIFNLGGTVYAFDSTTVELCLAVFCWAKFRKTKAGVKMHTQLDLRSNLPVFIHLTEASVHDVKMLDDLCVEMGAIYLLDKGYIDFFRLFNRIHRNGAFFVVRAKKNLQYKAVKWKRRMPKNVLSDSIIELIR